MRASLPLRHGLRSVLAGALALSATVADASAFGLSRTPFQPLAQMFGTADPAAAADDHRLEFAQGGCSAAAAQAAAQSGGQVLSVQSAEQGGRTVCIVTVLIPGRDGGRPRRQTITVPQ